MTLRRCQLVGDCVPSPSARLMLQYSQGHYLSFYQAHGPDVISFFCVPPSLYLCFYHPGRRCSDEPCIHERVWCSYTVGDLCISTLYLSMCLRMNLLSERNLGFTIVFLSTQCSPRSHLRRSFTALWRPGRAWARAVGAMRSAYFPRSFPPLSRSTICYGSYYVSSNAFLLSDISTCKT